MKIMSGVFTDEATGKQVTTGTPIMLLIENVDQRSKDYSEIKDKYRPGHAGYTYDVKYGITDYRGGGRASARETAARVAAGAIARKIVPGLTVRGALVQMGPHKIDRARWDWNEVGNNPFFCPDAKQAKFFEELSRRRAQGRLLLRRGDRGGRRRRAAGLGAPVYAKLDGDLAGALMGINAVKGVEIGDGFATAAMSGEDNADEMRMGNDGKPVFLSNHAGGILGGISTGQPIVARFAVKPTSSILTPRKTVDRYGRDTEVVTKGRHDPCVGIRAVPIGEAMVACVLGRSLSDASRPSRRGDGVAVPAPLTPHSRGQRVSESHNRVDAAIKAFAKGEIVVVTDDDDRENEGDLFVAASLCTPEKMAFIIRNTSGIVCAPLGAEHARRLRLDPMVAENDAPLGTAFTVSVDVRHGLTTGISAEERCNTVRALANDNSGAADFVRPGHVFPLLARQGGVLMRSGHTEACVDLCRLAGLPPVGVLSELMNDDGTVMRGPEVAAFAEKHKLAQVSIAELIAYRQNRDKLVERVGEFPVSLRDRHAQRLRLCHAVRPRASHGLRLRRHRRRRERAGAAAPRRRDRRRVRRRQADPRGARALQGGRPRRHRLSARRHRRRAGGRNSARGRHRHRCRPLAAMARDRPRRANPEGPRHFLDPPARLQQAHLCRPRRLRHRDRRDRADRRLTAFFLPRTRALLCRHGRRAWGDVVSPGLPVWRRGLVAVAFAAWAAPHPQRFADKSPNAVPVDVELILAVDVSYSMDPDEQALQREGYIRALTSPEFMRALREGANGKIAITYFEWAGEFDQKVVCRGG